MSKPKKPKAALTENLTQAIVSTAMREGTPIGTGPLADTVEVVHTARAHHPFSPSKLQILEACPKFKGTDGTNEAAERGTAMHEASETLDFTGLNQEEAEAVREYLDFIACAKDAMGPGTTELTEIRVAIDQYETTAGFLDKALISADETEAHLIDLKTGYGDIEDADNNLQGMAYGIGLRRKFPKLRKVKVSFVMPRQAVKETTYTFTAEELDAAYARIVIIVKRAKRAKFTAGFAMATPHTGVCRFCAHFDGSSGRLCPKPAELMSKATKHMPIEVIAPELMLTASDPATLGKMMDMFKYMEECIKVYKARILAIARSGGEVEGYGVSCVPEREVVAEKVIEVALKEALMKTGIEEADADTIVNGCKTLRLSAVDEAIRDAAPKGAKREAEAAFRKQLLDSGAVQMSTPKVFLKRGKAFQMPEGIFNGIATDSAASVSAAPMEAGNDGKLYL